MVKRSGDLKRVLVVGAGRALGAGIATRLAKAGHRVTATRFQRMDHDDALEAAGARLAALDITDLSAVSRLGEGHDAAILVPILSLSGPAARTLVEAGVRLGVVFSSNNVDRVPDAPVYRALAAAETSLVEHAPNWAILRPTMIYGHFGADALARLLQQAARWPAIPIPGRGRALQQPIHIQDLQVLADALATGAWMACGILPLGGPEILSQSDLVSKVYAAVGRRPRAIHLPLGPLSLAARLGVPLPLDRHQLARVEIDKHVAQPPDIPGALKPKTHLDDALPAMARKLGLTQRDR